MALNLFYTYTQITRINIINMINPVISVVVVVVVVFFLFFFTALPHSTITSGALSQNPCRNGWAYFKGSCYGFGHERMTWPEAEVGLN